MKSKDLFLNSYYYDYDKTFVLVNIKDYMYIIFNVKGKSFVNKKLRDDR